MDILTHTLSGVAIGTTLSAFSRQGFADKLKIVFMGGVGGALPDFDVISLWKGFDPTIGSFFNLSHPGKEIYSAKFWYSHHGFLHSLVAGGLLTLLIGILSYALRAKLKKTGSKSFVVSWKRMKLALLSFFLGFVTHLVEDMPTPASTWGGVNFFWPLNTYTGGTGDIWWWNNYDIFIIVLGVFVVNVLLQILGKYLKFGMQKISVGILILGIGFVLFQVRTRSFDFSYTGHTNRYAEFEAKSKEIQKQLLGDKLYKVMEGIDNKLKVGF